MINEAIILAGGLGTRLREVIGDEIPKPMAPVRGRPFLEYLFSYLNKWGVTKLILATGHRHEMIEAHFGSRFHEQDIIYSVEHEPLGTGGAVKRAMEHVKGPTAYVLNGDTYFDANLWKIANFHRAHEADACMALRKVGDISRYGAVKIDLENRITDFVEKGSQGGMGFINGGTYIINRKSFMHTDLPEKFSIEKDYFERYFAIQRIFGVRCFSFFLDIGIPEDYKEAQDAFEGLIH